MASPSSSSVTATPTDVAAVFRVKVMGFPGVGRRSLMIRLALKRWVSNVNEVLAVLPAGSRSIERLVHFRDLNTLSMSSGKRSPSSEALTRARADDKRGSFASASSEALKLPSGDGGVPVLFSFSEIVAEGDRVETVTAMRSFHAFLLVADASAADSDAISRVIAQRQLVINVFAGRKEPPIFLAFSKCDLSPQISKLVELHDIFGRNVLLCSALSGEGCDYLFKVLADQLVMQHRAQLELWLSQHGACPKSSSLLSPCGAKERFLRRSFRKLRDAIFSTVPDEQQQQQQPGLAQHPIAAASSTAVPATASPNRSASSLPLPLAAAVAPEHPFSARINALLESPLPQSSRRPNSQLVEEDVVQRRLDTIITALSGGTSSSSLSGSDVTVNYSLHADADTEDSSTSSHSDTISIDRRSSVMLTDSESSSSQAAMNGEVPLVSVNQDLNQRFQAILDELNAFRQETVFDVMNKRYQSVISRLVDLQRDFISFVKLYGRIIIVERYVPCELKTIKPMPMGGSAGGEKYLLNGIVFKFAVDMVRQGHPMFGSDYAAAKVAGHELKGLENYVQCEIAELSFPMMCLIDFMGFRLVALTFLPLGEHSHRYGTRDAGLTTLSDPVFTALMSRSATRLFLAPHVVAPAPGVLVHSACDIEGHVGTDGRRYLLDFSRSMPPVTPDTSIHNGHLFRLFRKEALRAYGKPLCPDAFTGFISCDPNRRQYNADIRAATTWLLTDVVPLRARDVARQILEHVSLNNVLQLSLSYELHRYGINMRYLGLIFDSVLARPEPAFATAAVIILVEAVARVVKNSLRRILRSQMQTLKVALVSPYASIIIRYLNLVLAEPNGRDSSTASWNAIAHFAEKTFAFSPPAVTALFRMQSPAAAAEPVGVHFARLLSYQITPDVNGRVLLYHRVQQLTRVRLLATATERLGQPIFIPFADHDFVKPGFRIKAPSLLSTSVAIRQLALCRQGLFDPRTTVKALKSSESCLQAAMCASPLFCPILYHKALLHQCRLQLSDNPHDRTQIDYILADHLFQICIGQLKHAGTIVALENIYSSYARFLWDADQLERAQHFFLLALELGTHSHRTLEAFISLLESIDRQSPFVPKLQERLALLRSRQ